MAVAHRIAEFDIVELTKRVDDAPAGARGGVFALRPGETAMVEITRPRKASAQKGTTSFMKCERPCFCHAHARFR